MKKLSKEQREVIKLMREGADLYPFFKIFHRGKFPFIVHTKTQLIEYPHKIISDMILDSELNPYLFKLRENSDRIYELTELGKTIQL